MATVTIGHIIENLVQVALNDTEGDTWAQETLLDWANQGERDIVSLVPQANPVIESVQLSAGVKQTLPTGGIAFINVLRNMGTDGETPGRAITLTSLQALAVFAPNWSSETEVASIYNAMPDLKDPTTYHVSPPSDGTGYVELEYAKTPTPIDYDDEGSWKDSYLTIKENYYNALVNYILYRALSQDSGIQGTRQRALDAYGAFYRDLGLQPQQHTQQQSEV